MIKKNFFSISGACVDKLKLRVIGLWIKIQYICRNDESIDTVYKV